VGLEEEVLQLKKRNSRYLQNFISKNYNTTQAIGIIEAEMEATPERDEILDFIRNSS
jgi:hypothetical protein